MSITAESSLKHSWRAPTRKPDPDGVPWMEEDSRGRAGWPKCGLGFGRDQEIRVRVGLPKCGEQAGRRMHENCFALFYKRQSEAFVINSQDS